MTTLIIMLPNCVQRVETVSIDIMFIQLQWLCMEGQKVGFFSQGGRLHCSSSFIMPPRTVARVLDASLSREATINIIVAVAAQLSSNFELRRFKSPKHPLIV